MKKLMFAAVAAVSMAAVAEMPKDITAPADGYFDVTLTMKELVHAEKTVSKTFTTKKVKGVEVTAYEQFIDYCKGQGIYVDEQGVVHGPAGFKVIDLNGQATIDVPSETLKVKKITFKYSYFDRDNKGNYKTKVVSTSNKGLYDSESGKVYLWNTTDKVEVKHGDPDAIVESKQKKGVEQAQKGYVAYEVPLAMHKQFVATDDGKAAGGFTGATAKAKDGTPLDFNGLTAYGTGTYDAKNETLKTVSGNVVRKDPNDPKYGGYGTWKLNIDTKSDSYKDVNAALVKKGCVELVLENN